jgi:two-component system, chemotaxis family, sensor kinase CheA
MDDLLREFLTESNENLARLDREVVELERQPKEQSLIHGIFRTIHTIKGTCGFIGLSRLEAVAHAAESVLVRVRDGEIEVSAPLISDVLAAVDIIKQILEALEQTEAEPRGDDSALIAQLEAWLTRKSAAAAPPAIQAAAVPPQPISQAVPAPPAAAPVVQSAAPAPAPVAAAPQSPPAAEAPLDHKASVSESSLRVNVTLLDKLMNLVGELVLDRNRLIQLASSQEDSSFAAPVQHLNRVTSDLQEAVMKTRMQPIGNAWTKLPRLVRDLAQASGKQIELEMHGAETELDRQILQAIGDPLTHMIRNSADHGVETPDVRRACGKPERGTIKVTAFHEGGHVILEISDDGAGVNIERVRQKAVERGLVRAEVAAGLSDAQVCRFLFEPGFSTAATVTNVSGRGVGMDVVRSNIEKIGGSVDVESVFGRGAVMRIKIPLTLAIIPALVVTAAGNRYAIPQVNLLELVRLEGESARAGMERVHGAAVYRLRGRLLPLIHLRSVLRAGDAAATTDDVVNIVVVQADGRPFGLVVDGVNDTEEIVVKPLSRQIKAISAFAGTTIMGDGSVALILDVMGIAKQTSATGAPNERADDVVAKASNAADSRTVLVVRVGEHTRLAVPLDVVSRLEEIRRDSIEFSVGRPVVQYRNCVMPLVGLAEWFGQTASNTGERVRVVVHSAHGRTVGIVVDQIVDIVEQHLDVQRDRSRPGVAGTAVVHNQVTDVLDIEAIIADVLGAVVPAAA